MREQELFPSHHHTSDIDEPTRLSFEHNAKNQDEAVWAVMVATDRDMSASEVHALLEFTGWPITSIRRSMSNLQTRGRLYRLGKTKEGIYGKPEHLYRRMSLLK